LSNHPSVTILCGGVGSTWRGFERFATDLQRLLLPVLPVELLVAGRRPTSGARRIASVPRTSRLARTRLLPTTRWWGSVAERNVVLELNTFALSAWVHLTRRPSDVVIALEPLVAHRLVQLRARTGRPRATVVHIDGLGLPPDHLMAAGDLIVVVSPSRADDLLAAGWPSERVAVLPLGVDVERFAEGGAGRARARHQLDVAPDQRVVLSVAALNRGHKRVDHLLREVASMKSDALLLLCGAVEDPSLLDDARRLLGPRVRHLYVPPEQMADVYGAADDVVIASLEEGQCLAAIEGLAAGLPVIAHDAPHFRWLLGSAGTFVDMRVPGRLAAQLDAGAAGSPAARRTEADRFSWEHLLPQYLEIIDRARRLGPRG
jgi:glycosyltransferase involved in cell wall biosynthesis